MVTLTSPSPPPTRQRGSSVSYESTNTNVATVDSTGKVTIHAAGTTTIKATAHETRLR